MFLKDNFIFWSKYFRTKISIWYKQALVVAYSYPALLTSPRIHHNTLPTSPLTPSNNTKTHQPNILLNTYSQKNTNTTSHTHTTLHPAHHIPSHPPHNLTSPLNTPPPSHTSTHHTQHHFTSPPTTFKHPFTLHHTTSHPPPPYLHQNTPNHLTHTTPHLTPLPLTTSTTSHKTISHLHPPGPETWHQVAPHCKGLHQSPVNIDTSRWSNRFRSRTGRQLYTQGVKHLLS